MAIFPGVAKEVQRRAVAKINIAAALHVHNEVVHQGVAVGQHVIFAQRASVDLGAGRQTTAFRRHTVNGILELALACVSRLDNRGVVTGKLDVTVVIRPLHLPGIDTKLAHIAGITACTQPVLHGAIDVVLRTV
ncbi:Uncharacterised protein [Enterobacter cloacae]|nr:Uncharacterised protein [Enterobacter cloacae]